MKRLGNRGPEGTKFDENGFWRGPKSRKIVVWRGLVGSWGSGGRFGWNFRRSLAARWSKMDQVGAKLVARCAQESPRCCQDGQLGRFFDASGRIPGQCWLIFGVAFAARWGVAQSMKTNNNLSLLLDFQGSRGSFFSCFEYGWRRFGLR